MNKNSIRMVPCVIAVAAMLAGLVACVPSPSGNTTVIEGSRAVIYSDLKSLVADSSIAIIVKVSSSSEFGGGDRSIPTSIHTLEVEEQIELPTSAQTEGAAWYLAGDSLSVLQFGTVKVKAMAPLLEIGKSYLLFLTPTQLKDVSDSTYYIVGSSAGIYERVGDSYENLGVEGDTVPAKLSADNLAVQLMAMGQ